MKSIPLSRITAAAVLMLGVIGLAEAQPRLNPGDLATQLRGRYDLVTLDRGVALVPHRTGGIRIIQIIGGAVSIDGETVTGAQLRDRLDRDADLVLQVSYLDRDAQRDLADAMGARAFEPPGPSSEPPSEPQTGSAAADAVDRTEVRKGDIVRFGGNVTVGRNEQVQGDVVVIVGSADIDGEVTGEVTVIAGNLRLGPEAVLRREVNVIGGRLDRAAGARILGRLNEVGAGGGPVFQVSPANRRDWMIPFLGGTFWTGMGSLAATLLRLGFIILVGLVAVAVGSRPVSRIAARTATRPLRSGLIGLAAEVLFAPVLVLTVVVLAVSIIGIPLLVLVPFAVLLIIVVMIVGFVGLSSQVGQIVQERFGWAKENQYLAVACGVLTIGSVTILAKLAGMTVGGIVGFPLAAVGYFVEYAAWTVGFGAAILAWYEAQTRFGFRSTASSGPTAPPATGEVS